MGVFFNKNKKVSLQDKEVQQQDISIFVKVLSYMSDDEGDLGEQSDAPAEQRGAPAGGEELTGGEEEDTFMRL